MNEVILVTSSKDSNGIGVMDIKTGAHICPNLKNNVSDAGAICTIGGSSSYSGNSCSTSDYIAIAQSNKPIIHLWSWGKNQLQMSFHVQEVITSLASDRYGMYLLGGSKKGMIYLWEIATGHFLTSWQAHFKDVTRIKCSSTSDYFCSSSVDGIARCWDLIHVLETISMKSMFTGRSNNNNNNTSMKQNQTPHRYVFYISTCLLPLCCVCWVISRILDCLVPTYEIIPRYLLFY
jgi:pre-rRNA-processing protein IPI3